MKLLCKLFGHDYDPPALIGDEAPIYCSRCGELYVDQSYFNRSDLDESENVFPEKWLDKHMDWGGKCIKKIRDYLTKFIIFLVVFMTTSNMISMFFKNATTSDWILTIVISLIAAYQNLDWGGDER